MRSKPHKWAEKLSGLSVSHPWSMLLGVGIITVISLALSTGLEMRMNWSDTLPESHPIVKSYREVQYRFGDAGGIVVALEGDYDRICTMADTLIPRLKKLETSYLFDKDHLKDPTGFAVKLRNGEDALSGFIRNQLTVETKRLLDVYDGSIPPSDTLKQALIEEMNRLITEDRLYGEQRFSGVNLPEKARRLIGKTLQKEMLFRLNRWLLEAAYPGEIEKNKSVFYNVQARMPLDFFREHGFVLMKPNDFERMLRVYSDPSLIGTFRGINDDYEREYTDSESNLKRDEVEIARGLLGLHRGLEVLAANLTPPGSQGGMKGGGRRIPPIETAIDAISLGEPYMLSLDRRMLLIICEPTASMMDLEDMLESAVEAEKLMDEVRPMFPDVAADLTGISRICLDEMSSVGIYTIFLLLGALLLIYLLLARSFHGWTLPLIALLPLLTGIIWTMGLMYLLFGSLNIMTSMISIVLIGLGIDFAIHTISRFNEEIMTGKSIRDSLTVTLSGTGIAVITGGLTTAAAFLTLLIGETAGVYEFGAAAGFGVLLTLLAIFLILPPLLTIRMRRLERRLKTTGSGDTSKDNRSVVSGDMPILGRIARSGWRHPVLFIIATIGVVLFSIWAKKHIDFEYDFLELEPKGLKSVQLQREIPKRFGMSDHAAWVVVGSVEESRDLKEKFRKKPLVGDISAISDFIPPPERLKSYASRLIEFRKQIASGIRAHSHASLQPGDTEGLSHEINRLWDNLDLMSNLAYTAGLDRIVRVIDGITGTQTETGEVDRSAVLPTLSRILKDGINEEKGGRIADSWERRLRANLYSMANPEPINLKDLPDVVRRNHLPREGEGFLVQVIPRKYMYSREDLNRFTEQTSAVSKDICGSEQLFVVMLESILNDGRKAALLALGVIIVLVLIHFRGLIGLLSLVPLTAGAIAMLGLMYLIGEKFNYINLMAVPIILGIGIDDGIHALHRFRNERGTGIDRIHCSFSFVGRAILLSSLTTMIGFGSIAFYTMEGMASFGRALFMGVGACFLTTILVLPAVLRLFTRKE